MAGAVPTAPPTGGFEGEVVGGVVVGV